MKRFGEYLVEKGAVSKDQLVDALIEQLKAQPLPCEILRGEKLMDPASLLAIFNLQAERGLGFISAARELGRWSEEWDGVIARASLGRRPPLGEILVRRGAIELSKMTLLLDDYLSEERSSLEGVAPVAAAPQPREDVIAAPVPTSSPAPAAEVTRCKEASSPVQAFLEATSESVRQEFENIFSFMEMWDDFKGQSQQLVLADLISSLQKIQSAAEGAGAPASAHLVGGLAVAIQNLMESSAKLGPDVPAKVGRVGNRAIAQLWDLRESLRSDGVEGKASGVEEILQASEGLQPAGGTS